MNSREETILKWLMGDESWSHWAQGLGKQTVSDVVLEGLREIRKMRWPRLVGQLGGLFKVYSDCHSYRQNLLGQIFLSLLLRL